MNIPNDCGIISTRSLLFTFYSDSFNTRSFRSFKVWKEQCKKQMHSHSKPNTVHEKNIHVRCDGKSRAARKLRFSCTIRYPVRKMLQWKRYFKFSQQINISYYICSSHLYRFPIRRSILLSLCPQLLYLFWCFPPYSAVDKEHHQPYKREYWCDHSNHVPGIEYFVEFTFLSIFPLVPYLQILYQYRYYKRQNCIREGAKRIMYAKITKGMAAIVRPTSHPSAIRFKASRRVMYLWKSMKYAREIEY